MSIAQEVTRLGTAKAGLKTSIEGKGVTVPEETKIDGYPALVDRIAQGGVTDNVAFATSLKHTFQSAEFPTTNLVIDVSRCTKYEDPFDRSNLETLTFSAIPQSYVSCSGMVEVMPALTEFSFPGAFHISSARYLFYNCPNLKTVNGVLDFSEIKTADLFYAFCQNSTAIENLTFAPSSIFASIGLQQSALLSAASLQSIVDALADLTGQTAQTLTLHSDAKTRLTAAQRQTITGKNWTLA